MKPDSIYFIKYHNIFRMTRENAKAFLVALGDVSLPEEPDIAAYGDDLGPVIHAVEDMSTVDVQRYLDILRGHHG